MADPTPAPPRDNLIRMLGVAPELRKAEDGSGMPTMVGHFGPFNQWTEIHSAWEGDFMERVAPGAFSKTFSENRNNMRVLFQHGQDPSIGEKVLGPIAELREDENGGYFEVPLLDTSYNRDLAAGLEQGLYGTSWRFGVMKESFVRSPKKSDYNPEGIPERTLLEMRVAEFGPVTFPAYAGASAGVRSLTDDFIVRQLMGDPDKLARLLAQYGRTALPGAASTTHSEAGSRKQAVVPVHRFQSQGDFLAWLKDRA